MDITFIGHSCFLIKGKECTVLVDPYDPEYVGFKLPKLSTDVVLVTHDHPDHNNVADLVDYKLLIDGPGEYETKGVFIIGYKTYHDKSKGSERGTNTIYLVDVDGQNVLHLGDLGHEIPDDILSDLPDIDVLLVPVGGNYTIGPENAAKVISSIEPRYVVPMHYSIPGLKFEKEIETLEEFLDEMGVENGKHGQNKLSLSSKSSGSGDTEVIVLSPKH